MKKKNKFVQFNDEVIDLFDIVRVLIKEKLLILGITLIVGITGLMYSINIPSKFYTTTTIVGFSDPTSSMFRYYDQVSYFVDTNLKTNSREDLRSNLSKELVREILYATNFERFIKNDSIANALINDLKIKEILIEEYIRDRDNLQKTELIQENHEDDLLSQFTFNFSEGINGDEILNRYIYHISFKVLSGFLLNIESILKQKINKKIKALDVAVNLDIFLPDQTSLWKDEYLKGEKLLSMEIKNLKKELANLQKSLIELNNNQTENKEILITNPSFNFKWTPIVSKPYVQEYSRSTIKNTFLACILGFILSIIIIFIKVNFNKISKK